MLPSNLDLSQSEVHSNAKCMPSVHDTEQNSPKETWSRIVQKGLKPSLQKKMFPMKGAFWNIRSLNKPGSFECFKDFIDNNDLDFVGIMETKKESFHYSFFSSIDHNFSWNFLPASGTAGGILVGFKPNKFQIINWDIGSFCVTAKIMNLCDKFIWRLVAVYGSPYEQGKHDFIDELHSTLNLWNGPTMFGGDFNLVRESTDKNNGNINYHWADAFNNWINSGGLIEIKNPTRTYTWTNNQDEPIMAVLDRVFVTTNLENQYPDVQIRAAPRVGSDHVPILVDLGTTPSKKPYMFRFEKWWLERDEFQTLVAEVWNTPCHFDNPLV